MNMKPFVRARPKEKMRMGSCAKTKQILHSKLPASPLAFWGRGNGNGNKQMKYGNGKGNKQMLKKEPIPRSIY
ncbi:hypothetical protein V6N13_129729 [Hibiscus sabdariffa]